MKKFLRLLYAIFLAFLCLIAIAVLCALLVWSKGLLVILVAFGCLVVCIYGGLDRK